jgi:hypothetical protein
MAKLDDEQVGQAFAPHLHPGETLQYWAFGVKQPSILLMLPLFALAIIPGLIAVLILTKNYVIGLTENRFVVLRVKSMSNAELKEVIEYDVGELKNGSVKTSTGLLFTHIKIASEAKPFAAKFHRAYSKSNRPSAMAIAEAISPAP